MNCAWGAAAGSTHKSDAGNFRSFQVYNDSSNWHIDVLMLTGPPKIFVEYFDDVDE